MGSDLLIQAFENFRQASGSLERVHQELSRKVMVLTKKLEEKNRELERNLAEKEKIRTFLDTILSNLSNGVLVMDRSGNVHTANRAFCDLLRLLGSTARSHDGMPVVPTDLMLSLRRIVTRSEKYLETTVGDKTFMVSAFTFRPSAHGEELMAFVFNDITERRRLEEERERQARLSAMGEMAIQLAHEIRNPLGGILLYLSLLKSDTPVSAESGVWIRNIEAGLAGINYIVTNMLQFHKPIHPNPGFFHPMAILREGADLMAPVAQERNVVIDIRDRYAGEVIQADRELLKQLVMNLLRNAFNAMPEGGRIKLSVDGPAEGPAGDGAPFCVLAFEDSGVGMDEEEAARVFEPFWSSQTGGHGIGLWVCRQIVSQHGGEIRIQSRRGVGTCILVYLPVYQTGE